ncbi:hypothetical protein Tco_0404177 [Tanacetum coccineum]
MMPTQPDFRFVVPTFLLTDDPLASLNKDMIFFSSAYSSRYPPTNNQFRTSSNPRTQAIIQNGQVLVQNVQGRQSQGHIAKQCTAKKGVKDSEWFKDKMLLTQAQEAGVVLHKEQQDFLADRLKENNDCDDLQLHTTTNFKADHVDAYVSDCDDQATASAIFMASLSFVGSLDDDTVTLTYDSNKLSEVSHYDTYHDDDVLNAYMVTIQDEVDHYVPPPVENKDMMLFVIDQIKSQVDHCNTVNQEAKSVNDSLSTELEKYKHNPVSVCDSEKTLILAKKSRLKMTEKQTEINAKSIDYSKLNNLCEYFVPQKQLSAEQLYWSSKPTPSESVSKPIKGELLYLHIRSGLNDEVKEMKNIFKQMEDEVDQCSVAKKCFEIEKKQLLINNDRFLEENISCDIICTYLRSLNRVENYGKIQKIEDENVSLSFHVSSLVKEREHLKLVYKNLYDSIKQTRAKTKLQTDSLQQKLNDQISENNKLKEQLKAKFSEPQMNQNGRVSYIDASGSKPKSNTRKDRIPQPSSKSEKNKVEAQPRKSKSSSNKNNHVSNSNANVKSIALSKNSTNVFLSCNECLFSVNHDACVVKYLKDVQKRKKAKSVKQKEKIEWKSTRRVFKTVGLKWIPTCRKFNLVGKLCHPSRNTSTIVVPPGKILIPIVISVDEPYPKLSLRYVNARESLSRSFLNS